jgi:hypothetical protein
LQRRLVGRVVAAQVLPCRNRLYARRLQFRGHDVLEHTARGHAFAESPITKILKGPPV